MNTYVFISALLAVFIIGISFLISDNDVIKAATSDDITPPGISNIQILDTSATSTYIKWETDENSDSQVNYGLSKNYGVMRNPLFDKQEHTIFLNDLLEDTIYYFRIIATDKVGNQKISNDFTFQTEKSTDYQLGNLDESIAEVCDKLQGEGKGGHQEEKPDNASDKYEAMEEGKLLQEILEKIDSVQEEKTLEVIQEHIQNVAEDVASPLTIILDNADVEVGIDYAIIRWTTNKDSNSIVNLATDEQYDENNPENYKWQEGDFDESVVEHIIEINGLSPATSYHYQVSSETVLGQAALSEDRVFTTKSILPEIYNLTVSKVEEESAVISWVTNIPTTALVEYTNLNTGESKLEGVSSYISTHRIQLKNLVFDTYYSAVVTVENEQNEKRTSDPVTFLTTRDEFPPDITKVNTESTLYPGSDNKVQTIVSWETDEASKCQLFYHRGIVSLDNTDSLEEETDFTTKHVQVVTNFLPANVYKFWIKCKDDAENMSKSDDYTMLTPSQEESIIDIILKNFEGTFGWIKKIKM